MLRQLIGLKLFLDSKDKPLKHQEFWGRAQYYLRQHPGPWKPEPEKLSEKLFCET